MNTNQCCEKCDAEMWDGPKGRCYSEKCPCHTAPAHAESREEKIQRGAKDFAERFEGVMKDLAKDDGPAETRGWEEEFDRKFVYYENFLVDPPGIPYLKGRPAKLKAFITKTVEAERKAVEEEMEQLRVQLAGCSVAALGWAQGDNLAKRGDYGWSPSFQDVLDLRQKYEQILKEAESERAHAVEQLKDEQDREVYEYLMGIKNTAERFIAVLRASPKENLEAKNE